MAQASTILVIAGRPDQPSHGAEAMPALASKAGVSGIAPASGPVLVSAAIDRIVAVSNSICWIETSATVTAMELAKSMKKMNAR